MFAKDHGFQKINKSKISCKQKIKIRNISRSGKDQGLQKIKVRKRSRLAIDKY